MAQGYIKAIELPQVIPVFPLPGSILLSRGQLPLNVFEPRYLNMVDDAMAGDRIIGLIQPLSSALEPQPPLARVGCAGRITSFNETSDGRYLITLTGVCRFNVGEELSVATPYRQVRADFLPFADDLSVEASEIPAFDRRRFAGALKRYLNRRELDIDWETAESAPLESLIASLSMGLPFEPAEKQALLEAPTMADRCDALTALLEIDSLEGDDDEPHSIQ